MKIPSLFLELLSLSTVAGFSPQAQGSHALRMTPRKAQLLSDMESMCLLNSANLFLQEYDKSSIATNVDQQEALLNSIEMQAHALEARIEEMQSLAFLLSERPRVTSIDLEQIPHPVLSEMDTMCLLNTATFCCHADNQCSSDDKEALVNRLNEQLTALNLRLADMLSARRRLKVNPDLGVHRAHKEEIDSLMTSIESALTMDLPHMSSKKVPVTSL